ncbi:hypothetical protein MXB_696 [Myxobolus squamalis]|nr:hypothetical protein MXB_696 [Myxobolus squamalis]
MYIPTKISDFRAFYLGGKASEDILDQSMISRNTSFDVDQSISVQIFNNCKRSYCDKTITNPLQWPEDCFQHFDLAFKKYLKGQHDLAISMVSSPIPLSNFIEIIVRFSNLITLKSTSFQGKNTLMNLRG